MKPQLLLWFMDSTKMICLKTNNHRDFGHWVSSMQVSIASLKKAKLQILAHLVDLSVGDRDFDKLLSKHFAVKFKEEYKLDVFPNTKACLRLRAACEKLKKALTTYPEAPLNIEYFMDAKDVKRVD